MDMRRRGFTSSEEEEEEEEETLALPEKFANIALNSGQSSTSELPRRPNAPDCAFYLRNGACKFGLNCRFNHPMRMPGQVVDDNYRDGSLENSPQIVCKFYLEAGECKYGESCRYIHSEGESKLQFNFLGLPIRLGEKECPFYMSNGICGYGAHCVFHHPNPTPMGGLNASSTLNDESVGQSHCSFGNLDAGESLPFSGTSQLDLTSWPPDALHMSSDKTLSFPSFSSSHISSYSERKNYLGPSYLYQRYGLSQSTQVSNASVKSMESFEHTKAMQSEEFPERPGQPECEYFMKTGECKFKSLCRFHHPKGWAWKPDCLHNDKGLPLRPVSNASVKSIESFEHTKAMQSEEFPERPGQPECKYFMKAGDCKFKSLCRFHHPKGWARKPDCLLNDKGLPLRPVSNASVKSIESFEHTKAIQSEEFPERPGQPECVYYMKTGRCKFKSICRFHHPAQKPDCLLNDKGLPLRPDEPICRNYQCFGICKFGSTCLFNHPVDYGKWISQRG
nr:zinc finger CCCH domain-containing protein 43-like isoform X1 [Ipomoea batatas]GME19312.1 zinc finger CCCH domain-containing protein 43-like isoform X1 [Ipomoea batatas]